MPLETTCVKCHGPITVPDEVLKEALELGRPVKPQHDVCPEQEPEPTENRTFHLVVTINEVVKPEDYEPGPDQEPWPEEKLAQFGATVDATTFKNALDPLVTELNKQWEKVVEQASIIDG